MNLRLSGLIAAFLLIAGGIFSQGVAGDCPKIVQAQAGVKDFRHTAFTRARAEMDVYSEASERCVKVSSQIGEKIGSDMLFANLNTRMIDLELKANQVMQSQVENRMQFLKVQFERYDALLTQETTSKSVYDLQKKELDQSYLELDALKLEREILEERRLRHAVRAPASWTVIERFIEPGEWVSASSLVGRVGDYSKLQASFALTMEELQWLKKQPVIKLFVPLYQRVIPASIFRISPAFDPETRKVGVDLLLEEELSDQRGGVRVELSIALKDSSGAISIPVCALEQRYEEYWLTREDGTQVQVMLLNFKGDSALVVGRNVHNGDRFKTRESKQAAEK